MIKILAIGNGFSRGANTHLYDIADPRDIEKATRITAEIVGKHKKEQKIWSNRKL